MDIESAEQYSKTKYLTEEDIKLIVLKHSLSENGENFIENYSISNASDKMLGFLCDYWKVRVYLGPRKKVFQYFIKALSVSNVAKAEMARELKLFEKELYFYAVIKREIEIPHLRPWSAGFIAALGEKAMVFEDMNALQYKLRDKFKRFDMAHTLEALRALARFHASSIIYEEKKSRELNRNYSLNEDFHGQLHKAGYVSTNVWFTQCMDAGLEAIKAFSNYTNDQKLRIENRWHNVWLSSLDLANPSTEYRNVICHRDLWNNNLMFHYKTIGDTVIPDDCVLVDFQAARYHPPAGDVMLLLYCNVDPKFREDNMQMFLDFYLGEIGAILNDKGIENVLDRKKFFESAEKQRQWGAVVCACLLPQFWIDDDLTTTIFCDTVQFDDILSKNKAAFVIKMMQSNLDYNEKVLSICEEIVERYCFH